MVGHSLGGAAAAGAMSREKAILGGVNLEGGFFEIPDVRRPFLLMAGEERTPETDPTWQPFSLDQAGWWKWVNLTGSESPGLQRHWGVG